MTNKAPIRLQLTAEALNVLFPAESEARVELQRSCVQEFVKRYVSKDIMDTGWQQHFQTVLDDLKQTVNSRLSDITKQFADEVVKSSGMFDQAQWRHNLGLSEKAKNDIKHHVRMEVKTVVSDSIREMVNSRVEEVVQLYVRDGILKHNINVELTKQIKAQVIAKLSADI